MPSHLVKQQKLAIYYPLTDLSSRSHLSVFFHLCQHPLLLSWRRQQPPRWVGWALQVCWGPAMGCAVTSWSPASSENQHWVVCGSGQMLAWDLLLHPADQIYWTCRNSWFVTPPIGICWPIWTEFRVIPPLLIHKQTGNVICCIQSWSFISFWRQPKHSYSISTEEALIYLINIVHCCFLPACLETVPLIKRQHRWQCSIFSLLVLHLFVPGSILPFLAFN